MAPLKQITLALTLNGGQTTSRRIEKQHIFEAADPPVARGCCINAQSELWSSPFGTNAHNCFQLCIAQTPTWEVGKPSTKHGLVSVRILCGRLSRVEPLRVQLRFQVRASFKVGGGQA